MKPYRFNEEKDKLLRVKRKIGFVDIIKAVEENKVIKSIDNLNKEKFPNQKIMLIKIKKRS